ncbi:MAG: TIGR03013 family PEP-CTERM/XrtA system glycosyltransferase [Gammaproteobacteria bacterium]|nr:MAG: TIGR03013 family PEP-CTERM/XrtA system glycosyltransferase [Gammaproteobacteria bacterium]
MDIIERKPFNNPFLWNKYIRIFRSYVPAWLLVLGVIELIVLMAVSLFAAASFDVYIIFAAETNCGLCLVKAGIFSTTIWLSMISMGLYQRRLREGAAGIALRVVISHVFGALALFSLYFILPIISIDYKITLIALIVSYTAILIARITFLRLVGTEVFKSRVLVLGSGNRAAGITQLKRWIDTVGYTLVGFINVSNKDPKVSEDRIIDSGEKTLSELVREYCIDEIVIAFDDRRRRMPMDDLLDCKMLGVSVVDLITFYERETYKLKLDVMDRSWLIFSDGFQQGLYARWIKRILDIIVSGTILLATLPIMVITAIAIKLESHGGIFYSQKRVGFGGKVFYVHKFRSMVSDAEKNGAQWASKNDSRITKVGGFIRVTRIDELPQLINVLKGDMSFVGPRPERPEFVEQFCERIEFYAERHRVKPGITGWAQVCYPYGASESDAFEKLQYDLYYAKNSSLFLDLMIILQTVEVVVWQKGAR